MVVIMPRRPSRCYRYFDTPPYTRKEYIRGVPQPKIQIFDMGSKNKEFPIYLTLVSLEQGNITHNALEALRIAANRYLSKKLSAEGYHLRIRAHPHHILRENKMMAFAGADRLQEGMRKAFGKPFGMAARVFFGSPIVTIGVNEDGISIALEALRRVSMKVPMKTRIVIEKAPEHIIKKIGFPLISEFKK